MYIYKNKNIFTISTVVIGSQYLCLLGVVNNLD